MSEQEKQARQAIREINESAQRTDQRILRTLKHLAELHLLNQQLPAPTPAN